MNPLAIRRGIAAALLAVPLLGGRAAAQDQATALAIALRKADVVVRAQVLAATDPSPEWHRLQFAATEVLTGTVGGQFALLEPTGACCGRSLFALQPGDDAILFLRRTGTTLHPFGGARGVLPANDELLAHLRALVAAPDEAARTHLLVQALRSAEPRIAADAAHALALVPPALFGAQDRHEVVAALADAVAAGSTAAAPLLDTALHQADPAVLDAVLPLFLRCDRDDVAGLLRRGLARTDAATLSQRLALQDTGDERAALRFADLVEELPAAHGSPLLRQLLARATSPRVQLAAAERLARRHELDPALARRLPRALLRLAEQRAANDHPYRSIDVTR